MRMVAVSLAASFVGCVDEPDEQDCAAPGLRSDTAIEFGLYRVADR